MSDIQYENTFEVNDNKRAILISSLRSALNQAESGAEVVSIEFNGIEMIVDLDAGEVLIAA